MFNSKSYLQPIFTSSPTLVIDKTSHCAARAAARVVTLATERVHKFVRVMRPGALYCVLMAFGIHTLNVPICMLTELSTRTDCLLS